MANVDENYRRKKLSLEDVKKIEPSLRDDILKSGILYAEYRTDDARLTIEVIKAARRHSAETLNYMEVSGFEYKGDKVSGVICHDHMTNGPWVDEVRQIDKPNTKTNLHLTKGVHIVVNKEDFNINNSIYFDAFDGRMLFAIPRGEVVYIGTTDTNFKGDQDELNCTEEDATYILKAVNNMFKGKSLTLDHIQSTWTGLRPLIQQEGKGPSELSRKEEIFVADSDLISIAGGKLTGYRKMAERIVDLVVDKLPAKYSDCATKEFKIHNNPFADYKAYEQEIKQLRITHKADTILTKSIAYLVTTYGKDANVIIKNYKSKLSSQKVSSSNDLLVEAQLEYSLEYEALGEVLDFIDRRTGWLFFNIEDARKYTQFAAEKMAAHLGKGDAWIQYQIDQTVEQININSLADIKANSKLS